MRLLPALLWLCVVVGCNDGAGNDQSPDAAPPDAFVPDAFVDGDIADTLAAIDGMQVFEEISEVDGYRYFRLYYDQPVDHQDPAGQRFTQQMTLLHRDNSGPMVMVTTGYHNFYRDYTVELTELLGANQLVLEHRYFGESKPDPMVWQHLTIKQSADDQHRIIKVLEPLYTGAWLTTGASKGGMTAIYHRRFYPDDVDGTVPYVAPISFGAPDERYLPFFTSVGEGDCAQRLRDFQRDALQRRPALETMAVSYLEEIGDSYTIAGSLEAVFEGDVAGLQWGFWQYQGHPYCDLIPTSTATNDEVFQFLQLTGIGGGSDRSINAFQAYYYQAFTELGYPDSSRDHVSDLLMHQFAGSYLPEGVPTIFEPEPMLDISRWVMQEGDRLLFVYGEWDPWTAGAFALGSGSTDSFKLIAPRQNHGAGISDLPAPDQQLAYDALERWTGIAPQVPKAVRSRRPEPRILPPMIR